jgi:hypothetical protein
VKAPQLRTREQQASDETYTATPTVNVLDSEITTAFGSFMLRRRGGDYLLVPVDSPGARLLTGSNDVFGPSVQITAVDDADALRQSLSLLWNRATVGTCEISDLFAAVCPGT